MAVFRALVDPYFYLHVALVAAGQRLLNLSVCAHKELRWASSSNYYIRRELPGVLLHGEYDNQVVLYIL